MAKILVVNNDIDTMSLLQVWLEKRKYKVKFSGDNKQVLFLLKDFQPDLVLIDVLKESLAEEIKKSADGSHIPVLMMTGYSYTHAKYNNSSDDVIEKPFNLEVLQHKIEKLLKSRRAAETA